MDDSDDSDYESAEDHEVASEAADEATESSVADDAESVADADADEAESVASEAADAGEAAPMDVDAAGTDACAEDIAESYIVSPDERCTSHMMSRFEFAEVISIRVAQISRNGISSAMIPVATDGTMTDARTIALAELEARKSPLRILRRIGTRRDGDCVHPVYEAWSPNEMSFPA